jgi:hypothetical protein
LVYFEDLDHPDSPVFEGDKEDGMPSDMCNAVIIN